MQVYRYAQPIPLADLIRDARRAVDAWDWNRGAYGHALSLAAYRELHPSSRYRYENFPCTNLVGHCPAFRAIFDSVACDKVSFRLLRRPPGTSYAWHTDCWKGPGVVRFQIPILSDEAAYLVTTDYTRVQQVRGPSRLDEGLLPAFADANAGHFERHHLEAGVLHSFDSSRVHTLVNAGRSERITLAFDAVVNPWLLERFPEIRAEIGDGRLEPLPRPGPLGRAVLFAGSYGHPLRRRLRRWRQGSHGSGAS